MKNIRIFLWVGLALILFAGSLFYLIFKDGVPEGGVQPSLSMLNPFGAPSIPTFPASSRSVSAASSQAGIAPSPR